MRWRDIGPFRGGRTVGAAGIAGQPNVFYIGVNNGGTTWNPLTGGLPTFAQGGLGRIGIAIADSDPARMYAPVEARGEGGGVYRSDDAGAHYRYRLLTWENEHGGLFMQTTVNLPDSLYQKSEALAASRGATVEQFIVDAVKKEVQGNLRSGTSSAYGDREVELPVIRSRRPGTLDLSHFDFDDLLAWRQRLDCPRVVRRK